MKKISAISLLLCLLFTVFGYQIVFQLQITEAKTEMKQHIHAALYHTISTELSFDQKQIQELSWMEEDEFEWNGEMYDVISKEMVGNSILIKCVPDNKETQLVDQYLKSVPTNDSGHQPSVSLLRLINAFFFSSSLDLPSSIQGKFFKIYKPYSFYMLTNFLSVSTPPPKVC